MTQESELAQVPRTPLEVAKRQFDQGSALFVDVRRVEDYQEGHVPGAVSLPVSGPEQQYGGVPRDRDVILY